MSEVPLLSYCRVLGRGVVLLSEVPLYLTGGLRSPRPTGPLLRDVWVSGLCGDLRRQCYKVSKVDSLKPRTHRSSSVQKKREQFQGFMDFHLKVAASIWP